MSLHRTASQPTPPTAPYRAKAKKRIGKKLLSHHPNKAGQHGRPRQEMHGLEAPSFVLKSCTGVFTKLPQSSQNPPRILRLKLVVSLQLHATLIEPSYSHCFFMAAAEPQLLSFTWIQVDVLASVQHWSWQSIASDDQNLAALSSELSFMRALWPLALVKSRLIACWFSLNTFNVSSEAALHCMSSKSIARKITRTCKSDILVVPLQYGVQYLYVYLLFFA